MLAQVSSGRYDGWMIRFFDIDDHARLPWRFHGLGLSLFCGQ